MSNLFFDNFGSGTGGSLSLNPNWEVLAGVSYPFSEYAGEVRPQNGTFQFSSVGNYCKYIPPSADYKLSADWIIRSFLTETFPSMRGRMVDTNNYYSLGINTTTRVVTLLARVSGSDTTLGTLTLPPEAAGTTVHFELIMDGNQISAVVGGTTLGPYTHSTLTAIGKTGLREYVGTAGSDTTGIGVTNYSIDTIDAGATTTDVTIAVNTGDATLSGTSYPQPKTVIAALLSGAAFSGTTDAGSAPVTQSSIAALLGNAVFAGITSVTGTGTITSLVMRDLTTKSIRANETGITVFVNDETTGELVVKLAGQTSNSSGINVVSDVSIIPGTIYSVRKKFADGAQSTSTYTAA